MSAFLTGSRLYGNPRPESDVDLVIHMTPERYQNFVAALAAVGIQPESRVGVGYGTGGAGRSIFRIGPLNLIVCLGRPHYEAFRAATEICHRRALRDWPLTREEVVPVFEDQRERRGIE